MPLAVVGVSLGGSTPSRDDAGAQAAFLEAYKVFSHPRRVNCHPAGNAPLQGDDGRPHAFRVRRGANGHGVFAAKCSNCHQAENQPGTYTPPGAPYPSEDQAHQGEPRWHLPSAAKPMVFEKRAPGQLCRQLLDKRRADKDQTDQTTGETWLRGGPQAETSDSLRSTRAAPPIENQLKQPPFGGFR
jgi:hypothetical protein